MCLLNSFDEYKKHFNESVKLLVKKGFKESITRNQIEKVVLQKTNVVKENIIPFSVTYSSVLPNIKRNYYKYWHVLYINNAFGNVLKATPVIAFRKNPSLIQIIDTNYNQTQPKIKNF